ncbi:hypothetical protein M8818_002833 [Zalaria obscura]|uniref:Uncharacterized protein n=1 Tax=Zalaria obscura TaxID=2024903 RepID=A0ACC3SHK8_9PEZI
MHAYANLPNGVRCFYREAGSASNPVLLLLHGFPSSSNQYRNLIPLLSKKYHVIAPDLPGFGFTTTAADHEHTFANMAITIMHLLDQLKIKKFAAYVFDYGAPTLWRIALQRPDAVTAIISQNGSAYEEALGEDFWAPLRTYWADPTNQDKRKALRSAALTFEATKWQYENGEPDAENTVDPAAYHLDWALLNRPGNMEIQLDLFRDYGNNVALYPEVHTWFRETGVPLLALWGKNDVIFVPQGAEAFKKDLPNAVIHFLDAGHFAVETHTEEVATKVLQFLDGLQI